MLPGLSLVGFLMATGATGSGTIVNPVTINNETASKTTTDGTAATASFTFRTDRAVKDQDGAVLDSAWISSGYVVGDYSIRVTVNSGSTPTGTVGSWLALSSNRTWSLTDAAGAAGSKTSSLKVEIKENASGTILDTATYTLTADSQAAGGTTTYNPVAGSYSNIQDDTATFTVTASASVVWNYTFAGTNPNGSIASGGSGTSITFTLNAGTTDKTSTITLTSGGKTWNISLGANTTFGGGGGP